MRCHNSFRRNASSSPIALTPQAFNIEFSRSEKEVPQLPFAQVFPSTRSKTQHPFGCHSSFRKCSANSA
jgi:hypothetical protein